MNHMRLDKFLSECSPFSRREIRDLVRRKRIAVNGLPPRNADDKIDAETACVTVDGTAYAYRRFIYLMLNKPQGYLSATEDARDPVVVDLVPEPLKHYRAFPVGRLDKDTVGLLLLTNDGAFDHTLTSPKKCVYKRYFARLDRPAEPGDADVFRAGMDLGDFTAKEARLEFTDDQYEVFIEIAEGKFHQVKRMCEKVGKTVVFLKRTAIGPLKLDESLPPGGIRELTPAELDLLR